MIKLIASDMDGTLLMGGAQVLPERIFPVFEEMKRQGVLFVAASGRQYANLRHLLGPMADCADYVCENGAFAVSGGRIIYKCTVERALGQALMRDIAATPDCEILLSGINTAYIKPREQAYLYHMTQVVKNNITVVDDIYDTPEDYIKISAFVHRDKTLARYEEFTRRWGHIFTLANTCDHWIDFIPPGSSKGRALGAILAERGTDPADIITFGDNLNDVDMLRLAAVSFAMASGHPAAIEAAAYTTSDPIGEMEKILREGRAGI